MKSLSKKNLKFITFDRKLIIYLETMTVEMVILDLLKGKNELSNISKIADCIRKEIKEMKDQMPWPPQWSDFEPEKFEMPPKLGQFLTCLMTSQENEEQMNNRSARKRLSLAQDIVCNATEGRVNTPKSVLLPTVVK